MSRGYPSNLPKAGSRLRAAATFGGRARGAATAVRALPGVFPGSFPKIPAPPNGVLGAALILSAGALIYKAVVRNYPEQLTPDGSTHFFWRGWHTSKPTPGQLPAESPCHSPTTYRIAWCSASSYQAYLGLYSDDVLCNPGQGNAMKGGRVRVLQRYPCPTDPGSQFDETVPKIAPPGTATFPGTGNPSLPDVRSEPRGGLAPVFPATGSRADPAVLIRKDTPPLVTSPMHPTHEGKVWAGPDTVRFINAWFGAGGELIDATRCVLFATGHTYRGAGGEKVIPKSQWGEAFGRNSGRWLGNKSTRVDGSIPMSDEFIPRDNWQPRDAYGNRLSPRAMGTRLVECLFANWLEDYVYGQMGKATTAMTRDLRAFLGPLGLESQIGMLQGDPAYEGLLGSYWER